mmetsp:Transcript_2358/g.4527  ORF Transcript_2358/g.4527 Transcript_2358/m.4527 type:complete len:138 (-) Transcript_2358:1605-2018(-)
MPHSQKLVRCLVRSGRLCLPWKRQYTSRFTTKIGQGITKKWKAMFQTSDTQVEGKKDKSNKPKRAMSAYLYFCKAHRDSVKAEHPELAMKDVQREIGKRWQETSEAERVPYVHQAESDRKRYDAEVEQRAKEASASS